MPNNNNKNENENENEEKGKNEEDDYKPVKNNEDNLENDFDFLDDDDFKEEGEEKVEQPVIPKKEEPQKHLSPEKEKIEKKMRSSFADFDEENFFGHERKEQEA